MENAGSVKRKKSNCRLASNINGGSQRRGIMKAFLR